ncbi:hypothetical protein DOTSEDRAFT_55190 [Dothistroma septosporum NZE10]|uniref:Uncharacterized protein n=1 Tax=Dothistroma septosporum (strain NZE10 / CBS 128990) TaxID=675120 RepID=N1PFF2_DOTSN|nr:hypothetical protein DOTSEDRAFT_55190 [Dothistroma septosporum NZE10]
MATTQTLAGSAVSQQAFEISHESATSSIPATRASTQVFAVAELVEHIIDHVASPLTLFALRRVNSASKEIIDMPKYKQKMFLEPSRPLRVAQLTKLLVARGLPSAMYPFRLESVYPATYNTQHGPRKQITIQLPLDEDWQHKHRAFARTKDCFTDQYAYKLAASWQDVVITPDVMDSVEVCFKGEVYWNYPEGQRVRLGDAVTDAVPQIRDLMRRGHWKY